MRLGVFPRYRDARDECLSAGVFMHRRSTIVMTVSALVLISGSLLIGQTPRGRVHDPMKAEVLTLPLLPEGFATQEVTVDAGLYWIDVLNRTSARGLRIEIDRMPGVSVHGNPLKREVEGAEDSPRSRFLKAVRLTPGTYRVRVAGRPSWVCALHVR
jgi:hypothetical protein